MQRLTKYSLLLQAILRKTDDERQRKDVLEMVNIRSCSTVELPHEKNNNVVSKQVGHKPSCTSTEDSYRLEILDVEISLELYYLYSENKGADQLRSYCEADLRLCFCIGKMLVFS